METFPPAWPGRRQRRAGDKGHRHVDVRAANWPAAIQPRKEYEDQACHISDILPTLIDVSGGTYPADFGGKNHPRLPGRSFASILKNGEKLPERTQHFALFNNMALIDHGWKIVTAYGQRWQLYDLAKDRTEMRDLAESQPEKLSELFSRQRSFFPREDVRLRTSGGEREPAYAPIYNVAGKIGPGAKENVDDEAYSLALAKAHAEGRQLTAAELDQLKQQTTARPAKGRGKKNKSE